jgi:hypothetical protein
VITADWHAETEKEERDKQKSNYRLLATDSPQPECPGCHDQLPKNANIFEHSCSRLNITFFTPRAECPACDDTLENPIVREPEPPLPPPVVTAVTPGMGMKSGDTPIMISGMGFVSGATVSIGGVEATEVEVISPTTISATTPPHDVGPADVVVTNPDHQIGKLAGAFLYSLPSPVKKQSPMTMVKNVGKVMLSFVITWEAIARVADLIEIIGPPTVVQIWQRLTHGPPPVVKIKARKDVVRLGEDVELEAYVQDKDTIPAGNFIWRSSYGRIEGTGERVVLHTNAIPASASLDPLKVFVSAHCENFKSNEDEMEIKIVQLSTGNHNPKLVRIEMDKDVIRPGDTVTMYAIASDPEDDPIRYTWNSEPQLDLEANTNKAVLQIPKSLIESGVRKVKISLEVIDIFNAMSKKVQDLRIAPSLTAAGPKPRPPKQRVFENPLSVIFITVQADKYSVEQGNKVKLLAQVDNRQKIPVEYDWSITDGSIIKNQTEATLNTTGVDVGASGRDIKVEFIVKGAKGSQISSEIIVKVLPKKEPAPKADSDKTSPPPQ